MDNIEKIEFISIEELKEAEYNLVFNPFDTTGCGYLEDDFIEELVAQTEKASEFHNKNKNITEKLLHKFID
jgi:hypothetical protein